MIICLAVSLLLTMAEAPARAPVASNPVVELKGKIEKVQTSRGEGMPFLEIAQGDTPVRVYLGSMRFLMVRDFRPKAGAEAEVKGYRTADGVVAIQVRLPAENRTLIFRDENGWPLWSGNQARHGQNRRGRQQR